MTHESNGIDIITALILNDISPLCKYRMDLVLQLKVGRAWAWGQWHMCELLKLIRVFSPPGQRLQAPLGPHGEQTRQ